MSELQDWLTYELYPAWYRNADRLMPEFGFKNRTKYWQSTTKLKIDGSEGDAVGKVYLYANTPYGLKDYTRGFITLWDYIQKREGGLSNRKTLQFLAEAVKIPLPQNTDYKTDSEAYQQKQVIFTLWEDANAYLRIQLFDHSNPDAQAHREYLTQVRGYSLEEIRDMEIGFLPSTEALYHHLEHQKGYESARIRSVLRLDENFRLGTTHRLTLPFRNPSGGITGLAVRTILPDVSPKYINSVGSEKGLFNLNAYAVREQDVVLTEGQFDALILSERCGLNGVAVTGSSLNESHLAVLEKFKVKSITLCFDGDTAGREAVRKAIQTYVKFPHPQARLYVMRLPDGYDPDTFLKEHPNGKEAFLQLHQQAKRYYEYLADELIPPFALPDSAKETDQRLDEIARTALELPETVRKSFLEHIEINSIIPEIGLEYVQARIKAVQVQKDHHEQRRKLSALLYQSIALNDAHQTVQALDKIREEVRGFVSIDLREVLTPYTPQDFLKEIALTEEGLATGYPSLDRFVRIPQGAITLVAGRTGHGKTTFLLNLLWSLYEQHPDKSFYFLTYEEERKYITLKLLNLIIDDKLHDRDNRTFLRDYIKAGKKDNRKIEFAKKQLFTGMESGSIRLIDETFSVERLAEALTLICNESPLPVGAVFLDYVQKIPSDKKFDNRQRELQHTSNILLQDIAKGLSLPLIVGAQLNRETDKTPDGKPRLHHLREAGDLEQDANLVLSVFNPAAREDTDFIIEANPKKPEANNPNLYGIIPLEIKALKNRDGAVNARAILSFNPLTGRILEPLDEHQSKVVFNG